MGIQSIYKNHKEKILGGIGVLFTGYTIWGGYQALKPIDPEETERKMKKFSAFEPSQDVIDSTVANLRRYQDALMEEAKKRRIDTSGVKVDTNKSYMDDLDEWFNTWTRW